MVVDCSRVLWQPLPRCLVLYTWRLRGHGLADILLGSTSWISASVDG
jgi:hypothetical protein